LKGANKLYLSYQTKKISRDLFIDDEIFQKILVKHEYVGNSVDKYINTTQTKFHTMPKGVVNLENLFDL
jgi:hypothetical protein